jgi:hypothetical protein
MYYKSAFSTFSNKRTSKAEFIVSKLLDLEDEGFHIKPSWKLINEEMK